MMHSKYVYAPRHWCFRSEKYTSGHSLHSALDEGWYISRVVIFEDHQLGTRTIKVYHFELTRGDEVVIMRVVTNPYVERVIREQRLQVVPAKQAEPAAV